MELCFLHKKFKQRLDLLVKMLYHICPDIDKKVESAEGKD